jgi:hypothetical protein
MEQRVAWSGSSCTGPRGPVFRSARSQEIVAVSQIEQLAQAARLAPGARPLRLAPGAGSDARAQHARHLDGQPDGLSDRQRKQVVNRLVRKVGARLLAGWPTSQTAEIVPKLGQSLPCHGRCT